MTRRTVFRAPRDPRVRSLPGRRLHMHRPHPAGTRTRRSGTGTSRRCPAWLPLVSCMPAVPLILDRGRSGLSSSIPRKGSPGPARGSGRRWRAATRSRGAVDGKCRTEHRAHHPPRAGRHRARRPCHRRRPLRPAACTLRPDRQPLRLRSTRSVARRSLWTLPVDGTYSFRQSSLRPGTGGCAVGNERKWAATTER